MELTAETYTMLSDTEGYFLICTKETKGICALSKFAFTIGLCYGIDETGYSGRYCYSYENIADAIRDVLHWDGIGDPKGQWIKHKGLYIDEKNPKLNENKIIKKNKK